MIAELRVDLACLERYLRHASSNGDPNRWKGNSTLDACAWYSQRLQPLCT
jgi:hypothetical protein